MIIRFEDARRSLAKALRKNKKLRQSYVMEISTMLGKKQKERMRTDGDPYAAFEECDELAEEILKIMFEGKEK